MPKEWRIPTRCDCPVGVILIAKTGALALEEFLERDEAEIAGDEGILERDQEVLSSDEAVVVGDDEILTITKRPEGSASTGQHARDWLASKRILD